MLPRLSLIKEYNDWIYFFIEVNKRIMYAVAEKDGPFWWVEEIE